MQLSDARPGQRLEIVHVQHDAWRHQALRLGLREGSRVLVAHHFPGGPVVLHSAAGEIAIGNPVAQAIEVRLVPSFPKV